MTKYKKIIFISLILALSFLIIGCGILAKPAASPEEISGQVGDLPVWLSLAHYEATAGSDLEDDALELGEADDDDFFIGPSAQATESAQAQATTSEQPAKTESADSGASSEEKDTTPPQPGSMAYIIWQKEQREAATEAAKKAKEDEKEVRKTLQQRVWEMTNESLNPSLDIVIKEPGSGEGDHAFDLN